MRIRYVTGDLFAAPERVLVHGCNAFAMMEAGIAAAIKRLYPEAYRVHRAAFEALDDSRQGLPLGSTTWARCADGRTIVNAVTQRDYAGSASGLYVDYEAVRTAMRAIDGRARRESFEAVAMPLIGAGLAGGSWTRIAAIVEDAARAFEPVVYLRDGRLPET